MKPKVFICLFFIAVVILAGCNQKQKSPQEADSFCPPQYLQAPLFVAPPDNGYVSTQTTSLQWSSPPVPYPYNTDGTCRPENFRLTLQKGPFFQESYGGQVAGTVFSWETPPLEIGTEYRWSVRGVTDNVNGPWSGSRTFFVGANCESGVTAPTLLMPFNGATIFGLTPTFMWQNNSDCIPYPWRLEIATDPEFNNTVLAIDLDSAATTYTVGTPLPNCTRYYWRIAASAGTDLETYSDTWSVRLATEGCDPEPGAGGISGKVWKDLCLLDPDSPVPGTLPAGCIAHTNGPIADGNISSGEPGIAQVIVHVARGNCVVNEPIGVTLTNEYGDYYLPGLQEGTYCLSVDPAENPLWLGSGWWTYPPQAVDQAIAKQEVILASDENQPSVNFGWQHDFEDGIAYGYASGMVFHDICAVSPDMDIPSILPGGCQLVTSLDPDDNGASIVVGNGILDEGEVGIPGVKVEVHKGYCSNPYTYSEVFTDANGRFTAWLEAGDYYCIKVYQHRDVNTSILGSQGKWSLHPNHTFFWTGEFFVTSGSELDDIAMMGWDYDYLPDVTLTDPFKVPFRYPKFKIDLEQANCRAGPSTLWQVYAKLQPGMEFEIKGITRERDWYFITPSELLNPADYPSASFYEGLSCWVYPGTGTTEGDLEDVEILKGPEYQTPTPTPAPVNCESYTNKDACNAHSDVCQWSSTNFAGATVGVCASK